MTVEMPAVLTPEMETTWRVAFINALHARNKDKHRPEPKHPQSAEQAAYAALVRRHAVVRELQS